MTDPIRPSEATPHDDRMFWASTWVSQALRETRACGLDAFPL
jgi:hypothetical protein